MEQQPLNALHAHLLQVQNEENKELQKKSPFLFDVYCCLFGSEFLRTWRASTAVTEIGKYVRWGHYLDKRMYEEVILPLQEVVGNFRIILYLRAQQGASTVVAHDILHSWEDLSCLGERLDSADVMFDEENFHIKFDLPLGYWVKIEPTEKNKK